MTKLKLSDDGLDSLQIAVENLLRSWDYLRLVELEVGFEITTGELGELACEINDPSTARRYVTHEVAVEFLEGVKGAQK